MALSTAAVPEGAAIAVDLVLEAQGEQRTVVTLGNGKLLDIDEAVTKVALMLQQRAL